MVELSIVIPVFNVGLEYVRRCFETVHRQKTEFIFEVIVVDDGSEPKYSSELLFLVNEFAFKYLRICNGGVSNARNVGVDNSKGEYVCFVDADDLVSPYFVQDLLGAAKTFNADYVVGLIESVSVKQIEARWKGLRPANPDELSCGTSTELVSSFLLEGLDASGLARLRSCPFARLERRVNGQFAYFDTGFALGEDTLQNLSYLCNCEKVVVVHNTCYLYRTNPDSVCHSFDPNRVNAVEKLLSAIHETVVRDFPDAAGNLDSLALCWLISLIKTYFLNPEYKGKAMDEFRELVNKPLWRSAINKAAAAKLPIRYRFAAALVRLDMVRILFKLCG